MTVVGGMYVKAVEHNCCVSGDHWERCSFQVSTVVEKMHVVTVVPDCFYTGECQLLQLCVIVVALAQNKCDNGA
jgi:hypothetical protein